MNIDEGFRNHVDAIFQPLNKISAIHKLPEPGKFSEILKEFSVKMSSSTSSVTWNINQQIASYFGTAAVEVWLRGVHSFLISVSLTEVSPIWASVSGYYSSHYSVRGIAHLLGYFNLFSKSQTVQLQRNGGRYSCVFASKPGGKNGGEHKLYWILVKRNPIFASDPIFTENDQSIDASDIGHRNFANYMDHLFIFPNFHPLDEKALKNRIERISKISLNDTPIPRRSSFPDVDYVQLIAYHRIISFRKILDEILGNKNKFWKAYRNPDFSSKYMDFQLANSDGLTPLK